MKQFTKLAFICYFFSFVACSTPTNSQSRNFPKDFMIGVSTSAYQTEGAVNEDGRGESVWDPFVHKIPSPIEDGSTADIATDSYHKYKEDIQLIKNLGFDFYRFSISWTRILPRGEISDINQKGIDYYNNVINELIANNIKPMVTMNHFDLPQAVQDLGGWSNPLIADYFEDFAYVLFSNFGDRVKTWITINEPLTFILFGYTSKMMAPGLGINGSGEYLAGHNVLRAHAKAYRLYERSFKKNQKGQIGISLNCDSYIPLDGTVESKRAADRGFQFTCDWFAHPIFSKAGDYPKLMREIVDRNSASEKRRRSRLPKFTLKEIEEIRGSADFFALNHYSTSMASRKKAITGTENYYTRDMMIDTRPDPSWSTSGPYSSSYVVPAGFRIILNRIKENYNNPPVLITENGFGDSGEMVDVKRINFFQGYLTEMLNAIYTDKCNVIGYTAWSLLDNFEWAFGYKAKYGLVHVDFDSPERKRTPKSSAAYFKKLLQLRKLPTNITEFI